MSNFAFVNGIQLHYLSHVSDNYSAKALPLILTPGLTVNAHFFEGIIQAGLSQHVQVLALDLRGRGLSDKPDTGYSMADHAADVIDLLDVLGFEQVILGGHSFGGLLTYYMAAHFPERVSKLVVIDAAGSMHPQTRELIQPSVDRLGKVLPSWDVYLAAMKQMPQLSNWWDPAIESFFQADVQINEDGTVQARSKPAAIIEAVEKALAEPWADHIAKITQPTLLLNGPGSYGPPGTAAVLPKELALETVKAMIDCRYVEVPGNHMTMLFGENAQQVVSAIADFIN